MKLSTISLPMPMDRVLQHCLGSRYLTKMSTIEIFPAFRYTDACFQLILVHSKPGMVHLWSAPRLAPGPPLIWSGSRTMVLQTHQLSVASSSLYPVSGMTYIRSDDALVLCLFDGSFHVIYRLCVDPSYFPPDHLSELTSEKLSSTSRAIFVKTSFRDIGRMDVNRISGMMSYDGSSTIIWAHEYVVSLGMSSVSALLDHVRTGLVVRRISATSMKPSTVACLLLRSYGSISMIMQLWITCRVF